MDGIELEFEDSAFEAIAHLAIERNTGARGLRSILEGIMMNPMYELPSAEGVKKVIIMDGRVPHALLIETLTDEGAGTMVTGDRNEHR